MHVRASISSPPVCGLSYEDRFERQDQGLIFCWLRGIEKAIESPGLAKRALAGELVVLPWKGGVDKAVKAKNKVGALQYLAMWQGMRGDDLNIDHESETSLICSRTGVAVLFTSAYSKLAASET